MCCIFYCHLNQEYDQRSIRWIQVQNEICICSFSHLSISFQRVKILISNKSVEIKNFLGEKYVRKIQALEGVTITTNDEVKDEMIIKGIDLEKTS